ncbi:MAG: 50S ribosomal protein L11 methyltransferase [Opitutales bacterium]|nr:50S ribosomal protein L11 methyltransferase [Opitutales bacterium]|tara:strand:+ start:142 stop:1029 length:888 start_codon:yes stop_codon:yes gene_type:complete
MIQVTCGIEPDLVDELEEHLCSWEISPWALVVNRLTGEGSLDGYFTCVDEAKAAWAALRELFLELAEEPTVSLVDDKDWKEAYKEHFRPWQKGSLHVVPAWEKESYPVPAGHRALYLDPGMAFGTGNHETTRLCLGALIDFLETETHKDPTRLSCLDVGCGSGILTLAAKTLGFGEARGFDIDPSAVCIAEENAVANGLSNEVEFIRDDLATALQTTCADLLLANVQADVLCQHRAVLLTALRPLGTLCLSGVLSDEAEKVKQDFIVEAERLGISVFPELRFAGEWAALLFRSDC